jgi:lipopolysaccharide export LptBFGC system permease protein LptF
MPTIRETYELPKRPPVAMRQWVFMCAFVLLALVLWLVLPDSPITVALLAIALLVIVFAGVASILRSRGLREPPPSRPTTPPSAS